MPQLSPKLTENLALLDEMFGSSADFYSKEVELYRCRGALVLFDGMASLESLWELLLDAVSRRTPALDETPGGSAVFDLLLHHSGLPAESSPVETLDDLTRRLTAGMAVLLLDSSYFVPWLFPCRFRLFSPVSYTERPAVAAAKLCEGKIIILVNGSPSAMILPTLFCENFDCLDDYATTAFFSSFLRILKYGAFYLSIFLPGAFVCTAVYLPELLPPVLLFKIAAAEKATPLPLFAEMVMIILILEIIREAGLRMPQTLGHSVSLVAALIVGDAAIAAGLMSTPVLLVAGITSVAIFITPSLYEPATLLRLLVVLAAGLAGPVGLVSAGLFVLFGLTQGSALGVPYLNDSSFSSDGVIRRNYRVLSRNPFTIWQRRKPE